MTVTTESTPTTFEDFTEDAYRRIIDRASSRFAFEPFGTTAAAPHVLWRHDVDISVHRALALARIEADAGARSTWFLQLRSWFYNLLDEQVAGLAREIFALGHWLGLHFDGTADPDMREIGDLERRIDEERRLLEDWIGRPVTAVSLHNPDTWAVPDMRAASLAGLPNAYGSALATKYQYVSDSNGYWRFRSLAEVLADDTASRLHVLTHPEWWTPEAMSPRERVVRSVDGRRESTLRAYDQLLESNNRANLR